MNNLKTQINGISFINPFILASAPPTRNAEMIARAFEQGWGGAVTKTICFNYEKMQNVSPTLTRVGNGLQNVELISNISPQVWAEDIKILKRNFPQNIVVASIAAEARMLGDWQQLALMMQRAGADIIELNLSCPHGLPEMEMGSTCSDVPEIAGNIVKAVKEVLLPEQKEFSDLKQRKLFENSVTSENRNINSQSTCHKIPIWAKLSPNVTSVKHLAAVCLQNGADGITAINTVRGFAGVDISTGLPKLNIAGNSAYGGISGELIKPLAQKAVSEIAMSFDCTVSATGGIKNWQDSVEFLLLGASTLQICTEVMFKGYGVINSLKQGLQNYLIENNCTNIEQLKGKFLKNIKPLSKLDKNSASAPEINKDTCIKCGRCVVSCRDAGGQAISLSEDGFPQIDLGKCLKCGLCKIICPAKSVIMQARETICSEF